MDKIEQIKGALDKLSDWVIEQMDKKKGRSPIWSWVAGLFITVIAIATTALMYYRAFKQGKELAKLKHEKDLKEDQLLENEIISKISEVRRKQIIAKEKVVTLESEISTIEQQIKTVENNYNATKKTISILKNWDDVDSYLADKNRKE